MSKEQDEAKALIDKTHQMERDRSKVWKKWNEIVFFTAFVIHAAFAVLVIACGAYAVYKGLHSTYNLARVGLIVAGVAAAIEGLTLLWNAVMKLKG